MSAASREYCLARAEEDARAAASATLENVRERCLRSEAVWRDMANRVDMVSAAKERNEAGKLAALA